jgi:hypothetical protein
MATHTPGPWAADDDLPEIYSTVDQHSRGYLAVVRGNDSRNKPLPADEVRANARLIAAAPELLAALKEVAEGCESRLRKGKDAGDLNTLRLCRAAITKAEGRTA